MAILFAEKDLFDNVKEERRMQQETRKKHTGDTLDLMLQGLPKRLALSLDNTTTMGDSHNNHENKLGSIPISEMALRGLMVTGLPGQVNKGTSVMKRWKKDLDPAMDYLINANFWGIRVWGCAWCVLTRPPVCCDLHNPTTFSFVNILPPATVKNAAHSHLSKYTMDKRELALCDALEDWREAKAVTKLGSARIMDFSTGFILPSPMIDCIVNSAHHLKLWVIDNLWKETHWLGVGLYGTEVLAIVHCIIPQPSDMPVLMRTPVPACPALQPHSQVQLPASLDGNAVERCSHACLQHPDRLGKENKAQANDTETFSILLNSVLAKLAFCFFHECMTYVNKIFFKVVQFHTPVDHMEFTLLATRINRHQVMHSMPESANGHINTIHFSNQYLP
ncbi:hypothetical protein EDC04DRAFT_2609619 [Pisolithus marmoratus]|nr:hypothetical protein EDC04DRAFT_2609619 [Pisolithus marmoratus]